MFWSKSLSGRQGFLLSYSAKVVGVTIILALILRLMVVSAYTIQSKSMLPTLVPGEFVIAWKVFTPSRGDVVVLPCAKDEARTCVKRVVGLPGDRIEITKQRLIVNAVAASYEKGPTDVTDSTLWEKVAGHAWLMDVDASTPATMAPTVVPPNHVFLLNDHRSDLADSREWGPISASQLEAKVWRIWLSIDWVKNRMNWRRILRRID